VPETADVGDGGSVFAPASGSHKRLRIEEIHRSAKKQHPTPKRICMGGGRVSGRSRENLISGLLPRVEIVQQSPIVVTPESTATRERRQNSDYDLYETSSRPRHLPPSLANRPTTRGPLTQVQEVRRYSEIHAETEAASARLRTTLATAGASGAQLAASQEVVAPTTIPQRDGLEAHVPPTTIPHRDGLEVDVAPTTIRQGDGLEVDVAPTTIPQLSGEEVVVAHAAVAQDVSSRPIQASSFTQTVSSMLQSFAFEDTRDGYSDDPNSLF